MSDDYWLATAAAQAAVARRRQVEYLISQGCQLCGAPAKTITWGPKQTLEMLPDPVDDQNVRLRITEEVRIRCADHPADGRRVPLSGGSDG